MRSRILALTISVCLSGLWAGVEGNISGIITDPQGAVVSGAIVTAINRDTNVQQSMASDSKGIYYLLDLAVGTYELRVESAGFNPYRRTGVVLDAASSLRLDISLALGGHTETVTVSTAALHMEAADTQLGEVIAGVKASGVPLNGRSFTDLIALQPGVVPSSTITPNSITAAGASTISPSGDLNPGTLSINGQREYANGFMVNDADVVERFTMGAAVIPNLDSIAEFRILTGNFDAEYGNYSGGRINIVTKSGANVFHGGAFEFLRNADLNARNFFSPTRAAFEQNQFGATFGGPAVRNKVFFFSDFQGTRLKQGVDSGLVQVPSAADRAGNLVDMASQLTGTVNGQYWANQLGGKLGYTVSPGEPYYVPGCASPAQCVFPNAVIPQRAWSVPAQNLMPYIPAPNAGGNYFTSSSLNQLLRDDKGAGRVDANTRLGMLYMYYFVDDYSQNNPYPTQQGGANVPGFSALNSGRTQLITLGSTRTLGARMVNELHFSFVRDVNRLGTPAGDVGTSLVSQGFVTAQNTPSIIPNRPAIEGVENVIFNSFIIGETITGLDQVDNTYEWRDNLSRVTGTHTLTVGGEFVNSQVNALPDVQSNGTFSFFGSETGVDFADFLLGVASRYTQGDAQAFYNRNRYGAAFLQDSWRARPRLTVNYGIRWDVMMPWYEKYNQIQTLVPGEQSVVFPGAPRGLVFPGDPGIGRALAPARWNNLSPRLGLAYAPGEHAGPLGWLLGGPEKSTIRAGFGRFFSAVEGVAAGVMAGDAPYGSTYTSPAPPLFSNPFVTAASGINNGQRFPLHYPPLNASASNPNANIDWSQFLPITGLPGYYPGNRSPYSEQYSLTVQRLLGKSTLLTLGYVGSQSHHLLVLLEANPGNPAVCLGVSQVSQVLPGTPTCGPFGESSTYTAANGRTIRGTRAPFGSNFGSVDWLSTLGNSNYNALEVTVRHATPRAEFLAGYTYGKSLDISSSLSDQVNPLNYRLTYGPSAFDLKHNFVASYRYELPIERLFQTRKMLTRGWAITGITRFSTGFPVTLYNNSDRSLLGTEPDGVNPWGVDLPDLKPGPLNLNANPRNGLPYFNTSLFGLQPLGQPGNAPRRPFYGPGANNFDVALLKSLPIAEGKALQIRLEAFNVLNHAQFFGSTAVNGNITSPAFGQIVNAASPRLVQVSMKFMF